ncbi:hypothetical protein F4678DRAFT_443201 [Xylaria arbuscula]|nr:hypothetical protein F4678DRAFT_443201 [Xylaria arbuscula]
MTRSSSSNLVATEVGRANPNSSHGNENQWMLRLRELEYKLKEEREARQMDRAAARQRILDGERQNNELAAELVRAQRRKE